MMRQSWSRWAHLGTARRAMPPAVPSHPQALVNSISSSSNPSEAPHPRKDLVGALDVRCKTCTHHHRSLHGPQSRRRWHRARQLLSMRRADRKGMHLQGWQDQVQAAGKTRAGALRAAGQAMPAQQVPRPLILMVRGKLQERRALVQCSQHRDHQQVQSLAFSSCLCSPCCSSLCLAS